MSGRLELVGLLFLWLAQGGWLTGFGLGAISECAPDECLPTILTNPMYSLFQAALALIARRSAT